MPGKQSTSANRCICPKMARQAARQSSHLPDDRSCDRDSNLDLSMHSTRNPSGNRYEPLRCLSSNEKKCDIRQSVLSSRKVKEHKKARDSAKKRNKNKISAVDALDEQLSLDFDKILKAVDLSKQSSTIPAICGCAQHPVSPTILPELPALTFGGPEWLSKVRTVTAPTTSTQPISSQPRMSSQLPSWCPKLPGLVNNDANIDGFPLFFDLSKMPEPEEPTPPNREMQLVRLKPGPQPKKQSRFFPPLQQPVLYAEPRPMDIFQMKAGTQVALPRKSSLTQIINSRSEQGQRSNQVNAYAANLWGLLVPERVELRDSGHGSFVDDFHYVPDNEVLAAPYVIFDHRLESIGMPVELDGIELSFVHDNCITGVANNRDDYMSSMAQDTPLTSKPAIQSTLGPPVGLEELVVDQSDEPETADAIEDLLSLPPLPPTPTPPPAYMPPTCESELSEDVERERHLLRAFSEPLTPPLTPFEDDGVFNLFGTCQSPDSLCRFCQGPPEPLGPDSWMEDDDWSIASTSPLSRSPSVVSVWESEWGYFLEDTTWEDDGWLWDGDDLCGQPTFAPKGPW